MRKRNFSLQLQKVKMFGGLGASALQNAFAETQSPAQSRGESRLGAGAHSVVGFGQPNYGDEGGGAAAAAADDGEGNPSYSGLDEDGRPNWSTNTDWIRAHARLGSGMAPMPSAAKWATTAKRELLSKSFGKLQSKQQNTGELEYIMFPYFLLLEKACRYACVATRQCVFKTPARQ